MSSNFLSYDDNTMIVATVSDDKDKNSKIILVDMDNTIVDYSSSIAEHLKKYYPNIDITSDNWQTLQLNDLHFNRREIQSINGFFLQMKPIPGALEALKDMEQRGHTVFIVSSPSISGNSCHSEKSEWVKQHLGEKWARRLVLTKDKTIVIGDFLIDDKPYITGRIKNPLWKHITYKQPYNDNIVSDKEKNRIYLNCWKDWELILNI